MSIIKNAIRDPSSGAVVFTDKNQAHKAKVRRRIALDQKQKNRQFREQGKKIEELEFLIKSVLKGRKLNV